MKILIRHANSGEFVDRFGNWTVSIPDAQEFWLLSNAVHYIDDRRLKCTEIVMLFGDPPAISSVPRENVKISPGPGET